MSVVLIVFLLLILVLPADVLSKNVNNDDSNTGSFINQTEDNIQHKANVGLSIGRGISVMF